MDVLYTLQYVQYGNFNKENAGKSSHQFDLGALCFKTHWSLLWSGDFPQLVRSTLIKVPLRMKRRSKEVQGELAQLLEQSRFNARTLEFSVCNGPK
jgi:hypothetical protein